MCGVTATFGKNFFSKNKINQSIKLMEHRGPDDKNTKCLIKENICLGQSRLTINDLTKNGQQPIVFKDIYLICNGEIYNYYELKNKHFTNKVFRSRSDSEIIIHSYLKWGDKFLDFIEGMFAFILWDNKKKYLIAARDSLGIKPLYFYQIKKNIVLSSEINGLLPYLQKFKINKKSLQQLFKYNFISPPESIVKDVKKLKAGEILTIKNNRIKIRRYHNFNFGKKNIKESDISSFKKLLTSVINENFNLSDRKVGLFLSSGKDSLGIFSMIKSKIFKISINNKDKEADKLTKILIKDKVDQKIELRDKINYSKIIYKISKTIDEPLFSMNLFFTYFLCDFAKKNKLKVVLSGSGGDELFNSYDWHKIKIFPFKNIFIKLINFIFRFLKIIGLNKNRMSKITNKELYLDQYLGQVYSNFSEKNFSNIFYKKNYNFKANFIFKKNIRQNLILNDIYNYCGYQHSQIIDKISMMHHVEVRVPYFDRRLFDYLLKYKNTRGNSYKYILDEILRNSDKIQNIDNTKIGGRFIFSPDQHTLNSWSKTIHKNKNLLNKYFNMDYIGQLDPKNNYKLYYFIFFFLNWYNAMNKKFKLYN